MLDFIEFLEDLERSHQTVTIPRGEVEDLVARFGSRVRQMGEWHPTTDGSLEMSVPNIAEAARSLGHSALTEAVQQLKNPQDYTGILNRSCPAVQLIEELGKLHLAQFEKRVRQYEDEKDLAEDQKLAGEISGELFGVWGG